MGDIEHLRAALERAKSGDLDGFTVLVERFQDMAVGYSYSMLGDFHLAEDAAQEAFLEAYPNLHKPIDALRTAVSAMSGSEAEPVDNSHEGTIRKGIRITAGAPTILAAHSRMSRGKDPIAPEGSLGHAANFLYMLTGETADRDDCRALDRALILHAEHGANASSFAARTVASTGADLYSAITAALAALKGPQHGLGFRGRCSVQCLRWAGSPWWP